MACDLCGENCSCLIDCCASDAPDEPGEGDLYHDGGLEFRVVGFPRRGVVIDGRGMDDMELAQAIEAFREEEGFYGAAWFISDHGNAHPLAY